MAEIDAEVAELSAKLLNGPKRKDFLRVLKSDNPDLTIPEIEVEDVVAQATKPLLEKISKLEQERSEEKSYANLTAERNKLKDLGATEEDVKKVEKFMVENKVGSHELALRLVRENEHISPPSSTGGRSIAKMPELSKEFLANPNQGARDVASQVLAEMARSRK